MQWHYIGHIERKDKKTHEGRIENVFIRQKFGDVIWKELNQDHWEIKYNRYPSELESFLKIDVYASCKDPIKEMFFFMKHGDKIPIHKLGIQYGRDNDYIQWKQEQA